MPNFGEMAVAVVVIHEHGDRLEDVRVANAAVPLAVLAAPDVLPIPGDIAVYHKVEEAVVVQIDPCG